MILAFLLGTIARNEVWRSSVRLWTDVVEQSPHKPRGWINLGQAYEKQGDLGRALDMYQMAERVSLEPEVDPHQRLITELLVGMNISDILMRTGHEEEAHQILKQAWLAHPGFPGFAINLSVFYIQEGYPEKAIPFLTEGIAQELNYPWFTETAILYLNRAEAYRLSGNCSAAAADYAVMRQFPRMPAMPTC